MIPSKLQHEVLEYLTYEANESSICNLSGDIISHCGYGVFK